MKVLYFARARELAGTKSEEVEVPVDATVGDVLTELGTRFGVEFAALVRRSTVMVDDSIVNRDHFDDHPPGSEMAILPPVSGGDGPESPGAIHHVEHSASALNDSGSADARPLRVALLTISDRASSGEYEDLTGPQLKELIGRRLGGAAAVTETKVVEDSHGLIAQTIRGWCDGGQVDLVITNGGTGLSARDVTPEATRSVLEVEAPGLAEMMRAAGIAKTPLAALSRQTAGRRGGTVVVNVPGSVKGAVESLEAIIDVLPHACAMANQEQR